MDQQQQESRPDGDLNTTKGGSTTVKKEKIDTAMRDITQVILDYDEPHHNQPSLVEEGPATAPNKNSTSIGARHVDISMGENAAKGMKRNLAKNTTKIENPRNNAAKDLDIGKEAGAMEDVEGCLPTDSGNISATNSAETQESLQVPTTEGTVPNNGHTSNEPKEEVSQRPSLEDLMRSLTITVQKHSDTMETKLESLEAKVENTSGSVEEVKVKIENSPGPSWDAQSAQKMEKLTKRWLHETLSDHMDQFQHFLFNRLRTEVDPLKEFHGLKVSKGKLERRLEAELANSARMQQDVNKSNTALRAARRDKNEAKKEAEQRSNELKREQHEATKKALEMDHKLKCAQGGWMQNNEDANKRLQDAEARAIAEEAKNQEMVSQLQATKKDLVKLQRANKSYPGNSLKTSDDEVKSTLLQLSYSIQNLSVSLAAHVQDVPATAYLRGNETYETFREIVSASALPTPLISLSPDTGSLLLQAYLWRATDRYVNPKGKAQTALASKFEDLRSEMLASVTPDEALSVATWFAEGRKAIESGLDKAREGGLAPAALAEAKLLAHDFIPGTNLKALGRLEDDLIKIFQKARELSIMMSTSKAIFKCEHASSMAVFNQETMTKQGGFEGQPPASSRVIFSSSPKVVKYGNADGHHHDQHMLLEKARVVLQKPVQGNRLRAGWSISHSYGDR